MSVDLVHITVQCIQFFCTQKCVLPVYTFFLYTIMCFTILVTGIICGVWPRINATRIEDQLMECSHCSNKQSIVVLFPSFKTVFGGRVFRHVVLGIYHNGRYGALGMSRRQELMYKPLTFKVCKHCFLADKY